MVFSRRKFVGATAAAIGGVPIRQGRASDLKSRRPNILIFLTDDHSQIAQQAYGNPDVVTPHMSAIAADGVTMPQALTTCPVG